MSADDRIAIRELNYNYAYYVDSLEVDKWVEVFAPNAYFDESEFGNGLFEGHEAIRAYGKVLTEIVTHIVHHMTNHIILELNETTAKGVAFCIVESMRNTGQRTRYQVKYDDEYVKIGGDWKIARRVLRKTFPPEVISA